MKVVIAEKPSVAKNIADAIGATKRHDGFYQGNQYYITWAYGHLLELYDMKDYNPELGSWQMGQFPYIPSPFQYKIKFNGNSVDKGAEKQLGIIQSLIEKEEVSGVISACDYDREGQIIGDIILSFLEVDKPVERLLLNEWTPDEVNKGLEQLVPNTQMIPLKDAGIGRQWADWLIGINLTSVTTLKYQKGYGKVLNIGRVLLPTLKIIHDRDLEIKNFKKEAFYKLEALFKTEDSIAYEGSFVFEEKDKFEDKTWLKTIENSIKDKTGSIVDKVVEQKKEYPGPLFNLTGLQGFVTSKAKGWTSEKVLKVAQGLYEKKLITYPRTSSLALEESLVDKARKVLDVHKMRYSFNSEIHFATSKRVFDNRKVESHSAIMPTYLIGKGLSADEKIVYEAVVNRFVAQFMPVAEHEEATIKTQVNANEQVFDFISKGRIQIVEGWKKVESIKSKDKPLPPLTVGMSVVVDKTTLSEKSTQPPKPHTEKTLLKVMETCGKNYKSKKSDDEEDDDAVIEQILTGFSIGTPATRAETISKLKRIGYITQDKKYLRTTELGEKLIETFPIKSLFDLEYTGRLEKILFDIGKGNAEVSTFLDEMKTFVIDGIEIIKNDSFKTIQNLETKKEIKREVLGRCPNCGSSIVEGEKGYGCTNWRSGCAFILWKDDLFLKRLGAKISKAAVIKLLEEGELYGSKFISKNGTQFSAYLSYVKDEKTQLYRWKMRF